MKHKSFLCVLMVVCMVISMLSIGFSVSAAEVKVEDVSANADVAEIAADIETAQTGANLYGLADNVQDGQILQCWLWSYNNISKNLQKIAEQGFSAIQVSPIQPIKESTNESWSTILNSSWVVYQPVAFSIEDNYRNAQGTKTEFKNMCEKAHKYGIKVIVDTVFNHMANDMSGNTIHPWVPSEIRSNSDCWHDISKNISNFENRYESTHYCLTGLPDLNTANSTVQKHCTNFMKEAIDAGADGFRFDAAKHIETPSDASGTKSNFWPNVLNAATSYAQETRGFTPYYYGEILGSPGGSLSINAYTQYMSVTDAGSSDSIRNGVCNGNASQAASGNISNGAAKNKAVQWTESHDNHKDDGTNMVSEHNINKTWAIVGSKNEVCGMYLARPENMSTTMMGDADVTSWSYPEVRAVNRFKNAFVGQSEYLSSYGSLACIERGTSGMILVNTGGSYYNGAKAKVYKMASGTYKDAITGNTFTVSGGYIKGDIGDTGIAVVYNADSTGAFTKGKVTDFAVAGSFNNWSTDSHKLVAKDANTATVTMFLSAGIYEFKLTGNGLWYGNDGTIEDTTIETGWTMRTTVDENCTLKASGGKYTFTFNITTGKLVVMHEATSDKSSTVYLKGEFNEWSDTNRMAYVDKTNVVKTTVKLSAGTYKFKIHNTLMDIWYGNAGTITDTTGETGWSMKSTEADCTLKATGGTYTFTYNLSTNKLAVEHAHTVTFIDWDGTVLSTAIVENGKSATAPATPSREATAQYTYTFSGWDTAFNNITADTVVKATYTQSVNKYTVKFVNYNGNVIYEQKVEYGKSAVAPATPTREATAQYSYTFSGWDTDFSKITADTVVTAVYTQTVNKYTVTFKDYDGTELSVQTVEYGASAEAPEDPSRDGYKFTGWDKEFTNITEDTVVTAKYSRIIIPPTTGKLRIDVAGGTGFKISVNGGNLRPQGNYYVNTKMPIGTEVTVVVDTNLKDKFLGWVNESGAVVSEEGTYTFNTSGNDYLKAMYMTVVEGVNVVLFNNDKAAGGRGQIIDMQYYAAGDEILFPENPTRPGYVFTGWNMTAQDIGAKLSAGEDAVVVPIWEVAKVYIDVVVNGGTISTQAQENGKYLAYNALTVAADEAPAGQKFAHWTDADGNIVSYDVIYKSYPSKSVELTAVYVAENVTIEKKPLVFLSADPTTAGEKITYTISWDIDSSIGAVTAYGLMVVDANDYNADTFYHGSGDVNIFDRAVSTKLQKQEGTSIALGDRLYDHTYCAVSFVIYTDAVTGESVTIYSTMAEAYKPAP